MYVGRFQIQVMKVAVLVMVIVLMPFHTTQWGKIVLVPPIAVA